MIDEVPKTVAPERLHLLVSTARLRGLWGHVQKGAILHVMMHDNPPIPHTGPDCWCRPEMAHSDEDCTIYRHRAIQ